MLGGSLIDQLFNFSEERLDLTLLLLARYGKHDKPVRAVPPISQARFEEPIRPEPAFAA